MCKAKGHSHICNLLCRPEGSNHSYYFNRYYVLSFMDLILLNSRVLVARDLVQQSLDILNSLKENLH